MIFNSLTYIIFLTLVVCLYWVLPKRPRLWLILIASSCFYGFWRPEFLLVMLFSAATDYFVAKRLEVMEDGPGRRAWLLLSLAVNLGLLCYFKYLLFFVGTAAAALHVFGVDIQIPALNIILPLGISFYTFETISYVVDVYRRTIPAEKSFVMYGCFVTFFPKLVAGPVLRAAEMIPQFDAQPKFRVDAFFSGIQRILLGLFLKVAIADNISPLVDGGFEQATTALSALDVWTLAFLFGFQIYFDFAAYSSIAIGSARLVGIHVPENFDYPYVATSPRDFWRRWHISLSSWIRDYLYLPLQGLKVRTRSAGGVSVDVGESSKSTRHPTVALVLTWAIMGLWHGANWTFVVWGLYHAMLIILYRLSTGTAKRLPNWVQTYGGWGVTILAVMLGWIPFRAKDLATTFDMWAKVFSPKQYGWLGMRENTYLVTALLLLACLLAYAFHRYGATLLKRVFVVEVGMQIVTMAIVFAVVFVFLRPISQFIYFQF